MSALRVIGRVAGKWWKSARAVSIRPHISTLVLLVPVLALLVLANWPGWAVHQVNWQWPSVEERYEHGWPVVFLQRARFNLFPSGGALVKYSPWRLVDDAVTEFSELALIGDIAAGVGIVALAVVLIRALRRKRQSWLQFHLGELLAFVTLCAIALSFFTVRRKEYVEEEKVRGRLLPVWDVKAVGALEGPDWLLPLFGEQLYRELFVRVFEAQCNGDDVREVVSLRHLHVLTVQRPNQDQIGLLTKLPELEAIHLIGPWSPDDRAVEIPLLPRLRALTFDEPRRLSDGYIQRAAALGGPQSKVYRLRLPPTRVDNVTLRSVGRIKTLVSLGFSDSHITDADVDSLMDLHETPRAAIGVHVRDCRGRAAAESGIATMPHRMDAA